MIKFFRKIRQGLLTENKVNKYFLYAIGEIILVIIGILIALYINNRNEVRIIENKYISNLQQVQNELEVNIENTTKGINYYLNKMANIGTVMHDTLTIESYIIDMNNPNSKPSEGNGLNYIIFNTTQVNILNNSFIKLNQNTDKLPSDYYSIQEVLNKVYSHHRTSVLDWNFKLLDLENSNIAKFSDNYIWFNKVYYFEKSNLDAFKYFVNNPIYKNYVSQYYFLGLEHFEAIKKYRKEAIEAYLLISEGFQLNRETDSISKNFLGNNKTLNCYVGTYSFDANTSCEIAVDDTKLYLIDNHVSMELLKLSQTKFVAADHDFSITFDDTYNCETASFVWQSEGQTFKFVID
jgi:hypothetical protein